MSVDPQFADDFVQAGMTKVEEALANEPRFQGAMLRGDVLTVAEALLRHLITYQSPTAPAPEQPAPDPNPPPEQSTT
jgi:hypothetical protein